MHIMNATHPVQTRAFAANKNVVSYKAFRPMPEPQAILVFQQKSCSDDLNQLTEKYNIRNATFAELNELASALYQAREISHQDLATLTFNYDKAMSDLRVRQGISQPFPYHENDRRDWIEVFRERAESSRQMGNLLGYHNRMNVVDILEGLER